MQNKLINRVREVRESRGLTQQQVGDMIGKARGQVSRIESGKASLTTYWMETLSKALQCSPAELVANVGDTASSQIPIIGEVPGGDLTIAIQEVAENFILFPTTKNNIYSLRVRGNSMSRIAPDGSYVMVDAQDNDPQTLSNQPVVVLINNGFDYECSFKIFKKNPDRFEPYSIEPGYDTIFINGQDWKIFGRVIGSVGFIGDDARLVENLTV